ncbi:MAG: exosortase X [Flavobacteriales bacterium]
MLNQLKGNPFVRFIFLASLLYLTWYFTYEFYLHKHTAFDKIAVDQIVVWAEKSLQVAGYETIDYSGFDIAFREHVGVEGYKGVTVGAPCDGVVLYVLFIFFVVAFPGPIKHKLWFIPLGAFTVFYLNVLRVAALAVIMSINEDWLAFNHDYTFTIIVYSYVFALWIIWVQKFSPFAKKKVAA